MKKIILKIVVLAIALVAFTTMSNAQSVSVCGQIIVYDSCSGTTGTYTADFVVYLLGTSYCLYPATINSSSTWTNFNWTCSGLRCDSALPSYYIKVHVVSDQNSSCTGNGVFGPVHYYELCSFSANKIIVTLH